MLLPIKCNINNWLHQIHILLYVIVLSKKRNLWKLPRFIQITDKLKRGDLSKRYNEFITFCEIVQKSRFSSFLEAKIPKIFNCASFIFSELSCESSDLINSFINQREDSLSRKPNT